MSAGRLLRRVASAVVGFLGAGSAYPIAAQVNQSWLAGDALLFLLTGLDCQETMWIPVVADASARATHPAGFGLTDAERLASEAQAWLSRLDSGTAP